MNASVLKTLVSVHMQAVVKAKNGNMPVNRMKAEEAAIKAFRRLDKLYIKKAKYMMDFHDGKYK
jgi:ribosomal protein S4E